MNWRFLPVSRDRYETARADILRLQQRIEFLESLLVQTGFGVLQSALRKNGYMQIGEGDADVQPMKEPPPVWTQLDYNLHATWMRNYQQHTGATEAEARSQWVTEYGNSLPSRVLL